MIVCNSKMLFFALVIIATSECLPATATPITDDADESRYGTTTSNDQSVASSPLAECGIGARISDRSSRRGQVQETDNLLPMCLDATNGANAASLLWMPRDADIASGLTTGTMTGIVNARGGATAVVGGFCQSCLAGNTTMSTIPEPGTLALVGPGLIGLIGFAGRRFF